MILLYIYLLHSVSLAIQGLLCFHMNFKFFFYFHENVIGISTGIALNLLISLGSVDVSIMIILPVYEHKVSLHRPCLLEFL